MAGGIQESFREGKTPESASIIRRVLVSDKLPIASFDSLLQAGYIVDFKFGISPDELKDCVGEYDVLVVRGSTKVTKEILLNPGELSLIVRAGVGVDNIDQKTATEKGIIVANTPDANTNSAAEHTIALILNTARNIPQAYVSLKENKWETVKFVGKEVKGKTLGLIGLGNVGGEVARKAIGLDMNVVAFDPYLSKDRADQLEQQGIRLAISLDEVLKASDFISVHVVLNESTENLINSDSFKQMKEGVFIINTARGKIINENDLVDAVESGKVAGAALDVFDGEPVVNPRLLANNKIICTPHLGASTEEAQERVANEAADIIQAVFEGKVVRGAINMPRISPETAKELAPYAKVAEKISQLATKLAGEKRITGLEIDYLGEIAEQPDTSMLQAAVVRGHLASVTEETVNLVNYKAVAKKRGLSIREEKDSSKNSFLSSIRVRLKHEDQSSTQVTGISGHNFPTVVGINEYDEGLEIPITDGTNYLLLVRNDDIPSMVGYVTTCLGENNINIGNMKLVRKELGGQAFMVLMLDELVEEEVLSSINDITGVVDAQFISLS